MIAIPLPTRDAEPRSRVLYVCLFGKRFHRRDTKQVENENRN